MKGTGAEMGSRVSWPGPTQVGESQGHIWSVVSRGATAKPSKVPGPGCWKVLGQRRARGEKGFCAFHPEK